MNLAFSCALRQHADVYVNSNPGMSHLTEQDNFQYCGASSSSLNPRSIPARSPHVPGINPRESPAAPGIAAAKSFRSGDLTKNWSFLADIF